jgi:hypothetical protein
MHFRNPNYVQQPGSTRVQLFTLGSTAITGATWNQRGTAYRDKQIGTFDVVSGGEAKFEGSDTIDCPTKPSGYELLLTGDNGYVSWVVSSNLKPNGFSLEFL